MSRRKCHVPDSLGKQEGKYSCFRKTDNDTAAECIVCKKIVSVANSGEFVSFFFLFLDAYKTYC